MLNSYCTSRSTFRASNKLDDCRYAKLERGLGEIDRARAIYVHASVMADPRRDPGYWADWNSFEVGLMPSPEHFDSVPCHAHACKPTEAKHFRNWKDLDHLASGISGCFEGQFSIIMRKIKPDQPHNTRRLCVWVTAQLCFALHHTDTGLGSYV